MFQLDSYLAGIFDGEGCVTAQHRPGHTRLLLTVAMTDPAILKLFQSRFGGYVRTYDSSNRRKKICQWYKTGGQSIETAKILAELCLIKKSQLVLAIELGRMMKKSRSRIRRPKGTKIIPDTELRRRRAICSELKLLKTVAVDT